MKWIDIYELKKSYNKNIVFEIPVLKIVPNYYNFILGPNGSGKSTFLSCLLRQTNFFGKIADQGVKYSYAPPNICLPDEISIDDFLLTLLKTRNKELDYTEKLNTLYEEFQLDRYKKMNELSTGMKQKVILIQCLANEADVYLFDEPLNGLDSSSKKSFFHQLMKLYRKHKIIIITTHRLDNYPFKKRNVFNLGGINDSIT